MSKNKVIQKELIKDKIELEKKAENYINIIVKFLSAWPSAIGNDKTINLSVEKGTSIRELLDFFNEKYGDIFSQVRKKIIILLNSQHVTALDGLDTRVREKDKVVMFLPFEGG
ncbi:MAG: hypothetical protein GF329_09200 [Candidatus Lokiarchaeota archaeon]|nr:hypothetical protein [Candidatus Lokiarchaeota archaeon]